MRVVRSRARTAPGLREAAETLETTPAAIDTALQRARKNVDEGLPERSQQET